MFDLLVLLNPLHLLVVASISLAPGFLISFILREVSTKEIIITSLPYSLFYYYVLAIACSFVELNLGTIAILNMGVIIMGVGTFLRQNIFTNIRSLLNVNSLSTAVIFISAMVSVWVMSYYHPDGADIISHVARVQSILEGDTYTGHYSLSNEEFSDPIYSHNPLYLMLSIAAHILQVEAFTIIPVASAFLVSICIAVIWHVSKVLIDPGVNRYLILSSIFLVLVIFEVYIYKYPRIIYIVEPYSLAQYIVFPILLAQSIGFLTTNPKTKELLGFSLITVTLVTLHPQWAIPMVLLCFMSLLYVYEKEKSVVEVISWIDCRLVAIILCFAVAIYRYIFVDSYESITHGFEPFFSNMVSSDGALYLVKEIYANKVNYAYGCMLAILVAMATGRRKIWIYVAVSFLIPVLLVMVPQTGRVITKLTSVLLSNRLAGLHHLSVIITISLTFVLFEIYSRSVESRRKKMMCVYSFVLLNILSVIYLGNAFRDMVSRDIERFNTNKIAETLLVEWTRALSKGSTVFSNFSIGDRLSEFKSGVMYNGHYWVFPDGVQRNSLFGRLLTFEIDGSDEIFRGESNYVLFNVSYASETKARNRLMDTGLITKAPEVYDPELGYVAHRLVKKGLSTEQAVSSYRLDDVQCEGVQLLDGLDACIPENMLYDTSEQLVGGGREYIWYLGRPAEIRFDVAAENVNRYIEVTLGEKNGQVAGLQCSYEPVGSGYSVDVAAAKARSTPNVYTCPRISLETERVRIYPDLGPFSTFHLLSVKYVDELSI